MEHFEAAALTWRGTLYFERQQHLNQFLSQPVMSRLFQNLSELLQRDTERFDVFVQNHPSIKQPIKLEWIDVRGSHGYARVFWGTELASVCFLFTGLDETVDRFAVDAAQTVIREGCSREQSKPDEHLRSIKTRPLLAVVTYRDFERLANVALWGTQNCLAAAYFNHRLWHRPVDLGA